VLHQDEVRQLTHIGSRQVEWFTVFEFVTRLLATVAPWPAAGTPEWRALSDDDPRKLAAVLEAGIHWSLRIDAQQVAQAQAAHDISTAEDWRQLALDVRNHEAIRIRRAS
jgi:hypothetical protein